LFSALFLACLAIAVVRIRQRRVAAHREWMIRAFALGVAVVTMRPMIGLLTGVAELPFGQALGLAFWLAFTLHLALAELWVQVTRARVRLTPRSG
jgi:uncharacterized membrane protein YozB (DUF420 family)